MSNTVFWKDSENFMAIVKKITHDLVYFREDHKICGILGFSDCRQFRSNLMAISATRHQGKGQGPFPVSAPAAGRATKNAIYFANNSLE